MVDFMEDMLRIVHWYLDPKNHDEVAKIASKITKAPPERFGWLFTKADTYKDPNLIPNLEALQRNVDTTRELGFVKKQHRHHEIRRSEPGAGRGQASQVTIARKMKPPRRETGGRLFRRLRRGPLRCA